MPRSHDAPVDDFDAIADELYAVPPAEFVRRRDAHVRALRERGQREVAARVHALRRPTVSAWAVNLLAREHPELFGQLAELGQQLREATAALAGDQLRALTRQRRQLVAELLMDAVLLTSHAGHGLTDQPTREVEQTLLAGLTDPELATELAAGRLTAPAQPTGLGLAPASAAVGSPTGRPQLRAVPDPDQAERAKQIGRAEQKTSGAQSELDAARSAVDDARGRRDQRAEELAQLRDQLREAENRFSEAELDLRAALARQDRAEDAVRAAERDLARAQRGRVGRGD